MSRILVIEDEPNLRKNILDFLELEGFEVLEASDGHIGVDTARQHIPDLIISDISMPEMDGYQLLRELRTLPQMENVPAIALTGYGRTADIERAHTEGFADHLTKPIDIDELLRIVKRLTDDDGANLPIESLT